MRKIAIAVLLTSFSSALFAASLDAHTLTNSLHQSAATAGSSNEFAIVYGGQDISRGSIRFQDASTAYQPVLIG